MNWLELWAKWQVIGMIIGWIFAGLMILFWLIKAVIVIIVRGD